MQPSRRRRSRGLYPIRGLLTLVVIGDALGLVTSVLNWIGHGRTPVTFRIDSYDMYGAVSPAARPEYGRFEVQDVLAPVRELSLLQRVYEEIAGGTVWVLVTMVIAVMARRVVTAAIESDPFTVEMASRLQRLAVVVLITGAVAEASTIGAGMALYYSAHPGGNAFYQLNSPFGFWWIPLGFALLAFAAVVRYGCTLRAELDHVI